MNGRENKILQNVICRILDEFELWLQAGTRYEWKPAHAEDWDKSGYLHDKPLDVEAGDFSKTIGEWAVEYNGNKLPSFVPGTGWDYMTFGDEEIMQIIKEELDKGHPEWFDEGGSIIGEADDVKCDLEDELYEEVSTVSIMWLGNRIKEWLAQRGMSDDAGEVVLTLIGAEGEITDE